MTKGGVSKTVFFGITIGGQLANMAIAEPDAKYRLYFFIGIWLLVVIYWIKQTILDWLELRNPEPKTQLEPEPTAETDEAKI